MHRSAAVLPHNGFLCVALFALALSILVPSARADDAYRSEIERFRQRRVADLKAEEGSIRAGQSALSSEGPMANGTNKLSDEPETRD